MSLIKASILRAKEIIRFTLTYNPNNPNVFPIIKRSSDNFQYSKAMPNIFQGKKLAKSMSQAPNLGRLRSRSKFESQHNNHEVKNCRKNSVSCPYLLKASLYQFKRDKKTFHQSSNLIYVIICQGCKEKQEKRVVQRKSE